MSHLSFKGAEQESNTGQQKRAALSIPNTFNDKDKPTQQIDNWLDYDSGSHSFLPVSPATSRMTQWPASSPSSGTKLNDLHTQSVPHSQTKPFTSCLSEHSIRTAIKATINFSSRMPRRSRSHTFHRQAFNDVRAVCSRDTNQFRNLKTLEVFEPPAIDTGHEFSSSTRYSVSGRANDLSSASTQTLTANTPHNITLLLSRRQAPPSPGIRLGHDGPCISSIGEEIVMDLSIPSSKLDLRFTEPRSTIPEFVGTQYCSPDPDIVGTPIVFTVPSGRVVRSDLDRDLAGLIRCPKASSVYSRLMPSSGGHDMDSSIRNSFASPDHSDKARSRRAAIAELGDDVISSSSNGHIKHKVTSMCIRLEGNTLPTLGNAYDSSSTRDPRRNEISSLDRRASKGWWNYITTPFTSHPNTPISSHSTDEKPSLANIITDIKSDTSTARGNARLRENAFSPNTPYTSTTIDSDGWWEPRDTTDSMSKISLSPFEVPKIAEDLGSHNSNIPAAVLSVPTKQAKESAMALYELHNTRTLEELGNLAAETKQNQIVKVAIASTDVSGLGISASKTKDNAIYCHNGQRKYVDTNGTEQNSTQTQRERLQDFLHVYRTLPQDVPLYSKPKLRTILRPYAISTSRNDISSNAVTDHSNAANTMNTTHMTTNTRQPDSPKPLSPGLIQAMTSGGTVAMSDIPLTPFPPMRTIDLDPTCDKDMQQKNRASCGQWATGSAKEKQDKRNINVDEVPSNNESVFKKRDCISRLGKRCARVQQKEKHKQRCIWLLAGVVTLLVLIVVLITTLRRNRASENQQTQWLNLTGFPPIYRGVSTVAGMINTIDYNGCMFPSTLWSCDLPRELQKLGSESNALNIRLHIQWDNSSIANTTFFNVSESPNIIPSSSGNAVSANGFVRRLLSSRRGTETFAPSPDPPSLMEEWFLGSTTDNIVSSRKAGEATPFYASLLNTTVAGFSPDLSTLQHNLTANTAISVSPSSMVFPNLTALIPPPAVQFNGESSPALLLPCPSQQPLRLYDRSLPTEHYGFYTYYNRTIFLSSLSTQTTPQINTIDTPGGSTRSNANYVCTWAQTRMLIRIWTRLNGTSTTLLNLTSTSSIRVATPTTTTIEIVNNLITPEPFPYPVTVTIDRHGGDSTEKMVYCYGINNATQTVEVNTGIFVLEHRESGGNGIVVNPAPGIFDIGDRNTDDRNTDEQVTNSSIGGYDGGTTGCICAWQNWMKL